MTLLFDMPIAVACAWRCVVSYYSGRDKPSDRSRSQPCLVSMPPWAELPCLTTCSAFPDPRETWVARTWRGGKQDLGQLGPCGGKPATCCKRCGNKPPMEPKLRIRLTPGLPLWSKGWPTVMLCHAKAGMMRPRVNPDRVLPGVPCSQRGDARAVDRAFCPLRGAIYNVSLLWKRSSRRLGPRKLS